MLHENDFVVHDDVRASFDVPENLIVLVDFEECELCVLLDVPLIQHQIPVNLVNYYKENIGVTP
jgi:hypothetical protein